MVAYIKALISCRRKTENTESQTRASIIRISELKESFNSQTEKVCYEVQSLIGK